MTQRCWAHNREAEIVIPQIKCLWGVSCVQPQGQLEPLKADCGVPWKIDITFIWWRAGWSSWPRLIAGRESCGEGCRVKGWVYTDSVWGMRRAEVSSKNVGDFPIISVDKEGWRMLLVELPAARWGICLLLDITSCCGGTLSICKMSVLVFISLSGAQTWNKVDCVLRTEL